MEFFEYISKRYKKYINQPWNKSVLKDFENYITKDIIISKFPINQYIILSYILSQKKMIDVQCLSIFELLDIFVGKDEEFESLSNITCDLLIIENVACTYFKQKENLIIQMIESQKRLNRKCIFVSPLDLSYYKDYYTNASEFRNLMNKYSHIVLSNKYSYSETDGLLPIAKEDPLDWSFTALQDKKSTYKSDKSNKTQSENAAIIASALETENIVSSYVDNELEAPVDKNLFNPSGKPNLWEKPNFKKSKFNKDKKKNVPVNRVESEEKQKDGLSKFNAMMQNKSTQTDNSEID